MGPSNSSRFCRGCCKSQRHDNGRIEAARSIGQSKKTTSVGSSSNMSMLRTAQRWPICSEYPTYPCLFCGSGGRACQGGIRAVQSAEKMMDRNDTLKNLQNRQKSSDSLCRKCTEIRFCSNTGSHQILTKFNRPIHSRNLQVFCSYASHAAERYSSTLASFWLQVLPKPLC